MSPLSLLLLALIVYGVYRLTCRPRRIEGDRWLIVDPTDSPARGAVAVFALLTGALFTYVIVTGVHAHRLEKPREAMIVIGVVVLGFAFVLWHEGRKVLETLTAGPGTITTDHWPLAAGELAEVAYARQLRGGRPAGGITASLVRYEEVSYRNHNGKSARRRVRAEVIELSDGEAQFREQRLEARWRFRVPNTMGDPRRALVQSLFDIAFGQHRTTRWVLEVQMPLQGAATLDSHFPLKIDYIPGRTEFHLGA